MKCGTGERRFIGFRPRVTPFAGPPFTTKSIGLDLNRSAIVLENAGTIATGNGFGLPFRGAPNLSMNMFAGMTPIVIADDEFPGLAGMDWGYDNNAVPAAFFVFTEVFGGAVLKSKGFFAVPEFVKFSLAIPVGAPTKILPADSHRVSIIFESTAALGQDVTVRADPRVSAGRGISVGVDSLPVFLWQDALLPLIQAEWFAVNAGIASMLSFTVGRLIEKCRKQE